jgi:uncharacterized protein (TIGR02145 family)
LLNFLILITQTFNQTFNHSINKNVMKKSNLIHCYWSALALFVSFSLLPMVLHAQEKGTFKDARDGNVYNWAKIGTQTWMTKNLKYNVPAASWAFNNDSANEVNFGRLYTWKAAQTACPKGWHLPSDKEWGALIQYLGGSNEAGMKMQAMDTVGKIPAAAGVTSPVAGSSLLSGVRHADGTCIGLNSWGGCWSSGKVNDTVANNVLFAHGTKGMGLSTNDKNSGFSVRCIKTK